MITHDAQAIQALERINYLHRLGAYSSDIPQTDYLIYFLVVDIGQDSIQGNTISMNV